LFEDVSAASVFSGGDAGKVGGVEGFNFHIGSAIDDAQMDQATFVKIYHSFRSEDSLDAKKIVALRPQDGSFLQAWHNNKTSIGAVDNQEVGTSFLSLQTIAWANELKDKLKELLNISVTSLQNQSTPDKKVISTITDVLELLHPSDLISIVVSDLELYRKLHEFRQLASQNNDDNVQDRDVNGQNTGIENFKVSIKDIFEN